MTLLLLLPSSSVSVVLRPAASRPILPPLLPRKLGHQSSSSNLLRLSITSSASTAVEPLLHHLNPDDDEETDYYDDSDNEPPAFADDVSAERDTKNLSTPDLHIKELEELPEQWRRSKIAWLCKELPSHKSAGQLRILNAQRKWLTQEDATYLALHCTRIRENEAGYRVYQWMVRQRWFRFDFALATKLADYLGKDKKFTKCREIFDAIIAQGRVPSESTFHILTVAYLGAPLRGCVEDARLVYNQMIQLGGYLPRLSLHNSLFRALVSRTGGSCKRYLNQAEFIYHNLLTTGLEVHKDVYAGLIWLHSYQDTVDRDRIAAIREDMRLAGVEESRDVILSLIRASSKAGDVEETERTWLRLLLDYGCSLPSQAFVYRMELYAKAGQPMKSLEIFKGMKEQDSRPSVSAYHKIIEVMSRAKEVEIAETLVDEFTANHMKPLMPAFVDLMSMYLDLEMHDKLEATFSKYITACRPNRNIHNVYLESLARTGNLVKAEEIFNEMHSNAAIGTNSRSCNIILGAYLASDECTKAEKIYNIIFQKKYDVEPSYVEKLENALSLQRKVVKKRASIKLDQDQREILIGLLLGGIRMESDEKRRNHVIHFEFSEDSTVHSLLKTHIHERFYEWLTPSTRPVDEDDQIPYRFSTIVHSYFGFFADQFWAKGRPTIPNLIHRWLSPRVLAYWYMYGGFRISSGVILLKLKGGNREDIERIVKTFQTKSISCRVKRKGRVTWIAFQGSNAASFWELVEPYVLENFRDLLKPIDDTTIACTQGQNFDFDMGSDSDDQRQ